MKIFKTQYKRKLNLIRTLLILPLVLCATFVLNAQQTCISISTSTDDAEEALPSGVVDLTSNDLDMCYHPIDGAHAIGLRFNNFAIPPSAVLIDAYIQFAADETQSNPLSITIWGHDVDNSPTFSSFSGNISNRAKTSASVNWSPSGWIAGQSGPNQKTIDLTPVLSEVITRPGFSSGNSVSFILESSSSNKRAAETYEVSPTLAAQLCYELCIVGQACNDNNQCTTNDVFQSDCSCAGTPIPDSDNDGLCDAIDPCPNTALNDSDNDGVCDNIDLCIGYDDNVDEDNDGIPDGCDPCVDTNNNGICDDVDPSFLKVVINEINYRSIDPEKNIDFLEIYNDDNVSINLSGWTLTDGINYQFPSGTNLAAGGYLVVAADPSACMSEFGFTGAYGPYIGNLSGGGENVELRNGDNELMDEVDYESWKEWPCIRHINNGDSPASIQKMNPTLNGKHGGSWRGMAPTPKAINTIFVSNPSDIPIIKSVSKSPDNPTSSEAVRIKADIKNLANLTGNLTVQLEYQAMSAGSYIKKSTAAYVNNWTTLPMNDNGTGPDSTANNGIYTGIIPASVHQHRMLVRYRVRITTTTGFSKRFPDQNFQESNYAYYVYNGDAPMNGYNLSTLPTMEDFTVISTKTEVDTFIGNGSNNVQQYQGTNYGGEGTVVYEGKVYDHVRFRPRGGNSRRQRVKPALKFDMNKEHTFETVDDFGNSYNEKRGKIRLSGTWVNDLGGHGLPESLIYKMLELSGGLSRSTDYTILRIVDTQTETGNAGDFWGIYLIQEDFNSDYLKEHDLPEGNFWTTDRDSRFRVLDYQGEFANSSTQPTFAPYNETRGTFTITSDGDLPKLFGEKAAAVAFGMNGINYIGKHSYSEYYNSESGKYHAWWGDMDNAFGAPQDDPISFLRSTANFTSVYRNDMDIPVSMFIDFQSNFRSYYDLLLNQEQREYLVDMEAAKIFTPGPANDWAEVDHSRWDAFQNYDETSFDGHVAWYKTFLDNRTNVYIKNNSNHGIYDANIPSKPFITLTGSTALDNITLTNSSYAGSSTFTALEWRVGEWSDPSNPIYAGSEPIYEVEHKWRSGEESPSYTYTIPAAANLEAGKTYKIRVRYKDAQQRWSHWSDPIKIIPTPAVSYVGPNLVINEFLYDPSDNCGQEFIEIYNNSPNLVNLENFSLSDGIRYNFPNVSLAAYSYYVVARDSVEFLYQYGFSPDGDYGGSLDNKGETIRLNGKFDVLIDSVAYKDLKIWDKAADVRGVSLELLNPFYNNNDPLSWFRSDNTCGTPKTINSRICTGAADQIVINEINYNSNASFDPGEWIELHNPGSTAVNISDWTLYDRENKYVFENNTVIGPGAFLVISKDTVKFKVAFPNVTNFIGQPPYSLGNGGERISLFNETKCLSDYVVYDDDAPWTVEPDGYGPTLSLIAPNLDNALAASWETSVNINSPNGTPGRANVPCPTFTINNAPPACTSVPLTFTVNTQPGASHTWSVQNGTPTSGTGDSISVTFTNAGFALISVTTTYYDCETTEQSFINVQNCNTAPNGVDDNYTLTEDATNAGGNVLTNDTDPEGQSLSVKLPVYSLPSNGTLNIDPNGDFTYLPNGNYNGTDQFQYEVCDNGTPQYCDLVTVNFTITPVNDIPTPVADFVTTNEDITLNRDASGNDYDIDGDDLTYSLINQPNNGSATIDAFGLYEYIPSANYYGQDAFTYQVCDDGTPVLCSVSTINITVNAVNDAPIAVDDQFNGIQDEAISGTVLPNDSDIENNALVLNVTPQYSGPGTVLLYPNGGFLYTPAPGYFGVDSFIYQVCDDGFPSECSQATVTLDIAEYCISFDLKAILEGPYDPGSGLMISDLNTVRKLLPGMINNTAMNGHPYSVAPWNHSGLEGVGWDDSNYNANVVDWVLVSIRTSIQKSSEVYMAAGLIYTDGQIQLLESCITGIPAGSYYIVLEHRNHMAAMTPTPVAITNRMLVWDFSAQDSYAVGGFSQKALVPNSKWGLYVGDANQEADFPSYDINSADKTKWVLDNGKFGTYLNTDLDFDGDVNGSDKATWLFNNGIYSSVPK